MMTRGERCDALAVGAPGRRGEGLAARRSALRGGTRGALLGTLQFTSLGAIDWRSQVQRGGLFQFGNDGDAPHADGQTPAHACTSV